MSARTSMAALVEHRVANTASHEIALVQVMALIELAEAQARIATCMEKGGTK